MDPQCPPMDGGRLRTRGARPSNARPSEGWSLSWPDAGLISVGHETIEVAVISLLLHLSRLAGGIRWMLGAVLLMFSSALAQFQPLTDFQVDPSQTARLARTLNLLRSAGPDHHPRVRVVFYGQSITIYPWWREVEQRLRAAYPHARLEVTNVAISGFMADRLAFASEQDVNPLRPDLVILHAYGYESGFRDLLGRLRSGSTTEVLVQRDHPLTESELGEETDPVKLATANPNTWEYKNYVWLPRISDLNGCCLADVRGYWKRYCRVRDRTTRLLLADPTHPNEEGNHVMAAAVLAYLLPEVQVPSIDPWATERVLELPLPRDPTRPSSRITVEFSGTRVDVVTDQSGPGPVAVRIDGRRPSEIPELRTFRRATLVPGRPWPAMQALGSVSPRLAESWTLTVTGTNGDLSRIAFKVEGSRTGFDGEGTSSTNFVSDSGRVLIPAWTWLLGYGLNSQGMTMPPDFRIRWECDWIGMDTFSPAPPVGPGEEATYTLASGLTDGVHRLELEGIAVDAVRALRFFRPKGAVSARVVERIERVPPLGIAWRLREGGWTFRVEGGFEPDIRIETSTNGLDWEGIGPASPVAPDWRPAAGEAMRFYRLRSTAGN